MNKKYLNVSIYIWISFLISALIFIFFPQIDLFIASMFYDGKSFFMNGTFFEELFYYSVKPIIIFFVLTTIGIFSYNHFKKKNILNINSKVLLYIVLFLTIAPVLIVNTTLKENWGRARPAQTINFGGQKEFTPAFIMSDQNGYSFSSGHSAAAFSLIGFALLAHKRRKMWINIAISYGVFVSIARMSAGGHFFSDVVTSFFIVYISTHIIYKLVFKEDSVIE
ncbi:phosphatase PAP2 family protein [Sulfurimonas sp.]|uniref:phosphatase PAP2 family protein n=1 Tax=Sulfurimonas sp. TaxID=2022749 RepID=UPI002B49A645|nr:phosphatase PAP2 family protein [Sulfurimonas sp.]